MSLSGAATGVKSGLDERGSGPLRIWLYCLAALIFAMILLGGVTRLTDSGLSITEWQPIIGLFPPLNDADWGDAFQKYQQIPEYAQVNKGMSLTEFKYIYWWEWAHRFLGRMIGFAFLIPFLIFLFLGRISRSLMPKLLAMLILGAMHGVLGWYMVKSGLVDRIDVSQYRLAAHLLLAVLILGFILWVALELGPVRHHAVVFPLSGGTVLSAGLLILLVFTQIGLGALVAGLHAGKIYNSWPLMDGSLVPPGLFPGSPWYVSLFEDRLTVQFDHRVVAYLLLVWALIHFLVIRRISTSRITVSALSVLAAICLQAGLGIWTLLAVVPLPLAVLHQAGAIIVFGLAIWHLKLLVDARRVGTGPPF